MDAIKDHSIPHVVKKSIMQTRFKAFPNLFQSDNVNKTMILCDKLKYVRMTTSDNVICYLMKINKIHDQLADVGEKRCRARESGIEWIHQALGIIRKRTLCSRETPHLGETIAHLHPGRDLGGD